MQLVSSDRCVLCTKYSGPGELGKGLGRSGVSRGSECKAIHGQEIVTMIPLSTERRAPLTYIPHIHGLVADSDI